MKVKHARGPPRGPDVPPTVAANLPSISFDPRAARFCSRLSIVRETRLRDPSKNRDSTRGQSVSQPLYITFVSTLLFCSSPSSLEATEERWKKGTWKNFARRNRGSSSSKNARIGSSFLVLSHARIIGDNSWNFYRKSRTIQSPV